MKKKQAERECQCEEQTHNFDVKTGIRAEQREEPRRGRGRRGLQSQSGSSEGRGGGVRGREGGGAVEVSDRSCSDSSVL